MGTKGLFTTLLPFGGDKRDRTADLLHAMQALSQLSYTPKKRAHYNDRPLPCKAASPDFLQILVHARQQLFAREQHD